jgi:mono/diheme cytochrome c family protein
MLELNIKRPQFKDNEIMDIMAFIRQDALVKDGEYKRIYAPPGNPERGLTLMKEKNCLRCHSIHGKGGTIGPDLGNSKLRLSFTQIAGRMWNHAPTMWKVMARENIPIPKFSETEMSDVLSYIYLAAIQEKGGNPLNGKLLLQEKGCNNCHPIAGKGGIADLVAPDFVEKAAELELNSPTKVVTEMWNHIQPMGKRVEEMGMTWPTISPREISDITAYLVSLANKPKP